MKNMNQTQGRRSLGATFLQWLAAAIFVGVLVGCEKPVNPNDLPVSHWLNDSDACARASAAAIIKAGLPFPNYGTEPVAPAASGATPQARIKTIDVWVGPTRLVLPAELVSSNGGYAKHDPRRFGGLQGTLPNFYPVGPAAPVKDGMGPMVDVRFLCSMEESFTKVWGKRSGYESQQVWIDKVKATYEADAKLFDVKRPGLSRVSVNRRDDIRMIEVLYERGSAIYNDGMPMWEASYLPIGRELKGQAGELYGIKCITRHDAVGRRYGNRGWRCGSTFPITPTAAAVIEIYVSHVEHMPVVYEQIKHLLLGAIQPAKEQLMPTSHSFTPDQLAQIAALRQSMVDNPNKALLSAAVPLYSYIFKCVTGIDVPAIPI